ncbi:MAG: hypothetical protein BTN85_1124 [Candidatus Methanohalarchaeum thermophilum]|uniref:Uncharacterized protein n=1 Tax=Methanohalarchaeum thermophilum TaxID=1903181 RepID=A0A1Q6DWA5_METT1|nr:MAG: hypothetical protein BTN85_1124 [Candidatus Methanohalarchaeum thermophilum]
MIRFTLPNGEVVFYFPESEGSKELAYISEDGYIYFLKEETKIDLRNPDFSRDLSEASLDDYEDFFNKFGLPKLGINFFGELKRLSDEERLDQNKEIDTLKDHFREIDKHMTKALSLVDEKEEKINILKDISNRCKSNIERIESS